MKLREEEFYEQYHQHGGTTIIPTEIFNELYDDATEEIERQKEIIRQLDIKNLELTTIIKEVREWAKKYSCQFTNDDGELVVSEVSFNIQARPCDLFRILDKEVN